MNCKQIENLLPLYVSRDLDERREQLVAAHVQACNECHSAADEYRETRLLLQEFAPPAFSEDVYAEIRQNVWREIETESAAPSVSDVIAGWFRPRLTWAVATALLVAVSVLGIYLIGNRWTVRQPVAVSGPEKKPTAPNKQTGAPPETVVTTSPSPSGEGMKEPRQAYIHYPERKGDRRRAPDRADSLVAKAPDARPLNVVSPAINNSAESDASPARDSGKVLRMEIQTKDPNIRIIWFAQQDTKPTSPNSKGT
jgi:putative zinc finger protein